MARHIDDLGNAAHRIFEHIVGLGKGLVFADVIAQDFEQFFVQDHDQRVDVFFQLCQTRFGIFHAPVPFE